MYPEIWWVCSSMALKERLPGFEEILPTLMVLLLGKVHTLKVLEVGFETHAADTRVALKGSSGAIQWP